MEFQITESDALHACSLGCFALRFMNGDIGFNYWKANAPKSERATKKGATGTYASQEKVGHPTSPDVDRYQDRFPKIISNASLTIRDVHGKTQDSRVYLASDDIFIIRIIA